MLGDRWGVTDEEVARAYPCDAFVRAPVLEAWRGVTVAAAAAAVWPWLIQIRLAPYSYDWIDNLGRRSPRELRGLADPQVGEPFTRTAGWSVGKVVAVDPGEQLTGRIGGIYMSYVLVPRVAGQTRLLLKLASDHGRRTATLLCLGDLAMARRQLLNFAALAEGRQP